MIQFLKLQMTEEEALSDPYFIDRNYILMLIFLFRIIYLGIPMFTVMFALGQYLDGLGINEMKNKEPVGASPNLYRKNKTFHLKARYCY